MHYKEILKSLKTKYKHLGLSDDYLKVVAKRIATTVNEESEISDAVDNVQDELAYAQSQADIQRALKKQLDEMQALIKANSGNDPAPNTPPSNLETPPADEGEGVPEWAKAIVESNAALSENLASLMNERTTQANKQKLLTQLEALGVKESFYKFHVTGKTFEDDNQITEFANSLKESYDAFIQENANDGLKNMSNPLFSDSNAQKGVSAGAVAFTNSKFGENESAKQGAS